MALVMTGHGTIESAVEAMKRGAVDFLLKPFSMELILAKIAGVVELQRMQNGKAGIPAVDPGSGGLITRSPAMRAALNEALVVCGHHHVGTPGGGERQRQGIYRRFYP